MHHRRQAAGVSLVELVAREGVAVVDNRDLEGHERHPAERDSLNPHAR
jgi:hypothetical protein